MHLKLVLWFSADQGCCCIDEFDKMGHQHQALLEAMVCSIGMLCYIYHGSTILLACLRPTREIMGKEIWLVQLQCVHQLS